MKKKQILIIEGADACGKSELCKHIQNISNGKCHVLHSNFSKNLPKENHRKQHKLIAKFVAKQFDKNYYTENNVVILDRCYISDMTYGYIGYGSRGKLNQKFKYLNKLFSILTKNKDIYVTLVYCKPNKTAFDKNKKEELLNDTENSKMTKIYDDIVLSDNMFNLLAKHGIKFYRYDFCDDSYYIDFDRVMFY